MLNDIQSYKVNFEDLVKYDLPKTEIPFILEVIKSNVNYEFLIRRKSNTDKALIFGSGAIDANKLRPPVFQRHKWMEYFDDTLIYYNDPTLYLGKINIGWGQGTIDCFYLENIAEILKLILKKVSIPFSKTLFYGSSAGGFMSLILSGFLRESKALVNNPQTIVWNYYDSHVNSMFSVAYPGMNRDEIISKYKERLNVLEFYKKIKYVPSIVYLQNIPVPSDVVNHMYPFIRGLEQIDDTYFSGRLDIRLYSNSRLGHNPLNLDDTVEQINSVIST